MNRFKHYCPDWDFMLIDRNDVEFTSCSCNFTDIHMALDVLQDLRGYSGVGIDGNPYDTPSWNAALKAAEEVMNQRMHSAYAFSE